MTLRVNLLCVQIRDPASQLTVRIDQGETRGLLNLVQTGFSCCVSHLACSVCVEICTSDADTGRIGKQDAALKATAVRSPLQRW